MSLIGQATALVQELPVVGAPQSIADVVVPAIKAELDRRDWRATELLEASGVNQSTLSLLLKGKTKTPGMDTLRRLGAALEIDLVALANRALDGQARPGAAAGVTQLETKRSARRGTGSRLLGSEALVLAVERLAQKVDRVEQRLKVLEAEGPQAGGRVDRVERRLKALEAEVPRPAGKRRKGQR